MQKEEHYQNLIEHVSCYNKIESPNASYYTVSETSEHYKNNHYNEAESLPELADQIREALADR